mgnify:FL=1
MSKEFDVHYEEEFKTVKSGIDAIQAVLPGKDIHAKERLLFYTTLHIGKHIVQ